MSSVRNIELALESAIECHDIYARCDKKVVNG